MPTLLIKDETASGTSQGEIRIEIETPKISIREILRNRIVVEVAEWNLKKRSKGLVTPEEAEETGEGLWFLRKKKWVDADKQFEIACNAFTTNGFFILINEKQVSSLDEEVIIGQVRELKFIRLIQLVGG